VRYNKLFTDTMHRNYKLHDNASDGYGDFQETVLNVLDGKI
jgi:hypothetical protein